MNIEIESSLKRHRISIGIEIYYKVTDKLIMYIGLGIIEIFIWR